GLERPHRGAPSCSISASVPDPKFAQPLSRHVCELRVQRDTSNYRFLVSLRFGSSLRSKLKTLANFRTATLAFAGTRPSAAGAEESKGYAMGKILVAAVA